MGKRTVFGLVGAIAMVGAACAGTAADEDVLSSAPPPVQEEVADAVASSGGGLGDEGITVHGRWRIDVYEADGSLDRTAQFENALVAGGAELLASVLGRDLSPGEWVIVIDGGSLGPCDDGSGTPSSCFIREGTASASNSFDTLTLDTSTAGELVLAGQATIANDTSVDEVHTAQFPCPSTTTAPDCVTSTASMSIIPFTNKFASDDTTDEFDPVAVAAGQVVNVTVTLSFS